MKVRNVIQSGIRRGAFSLIELLVAVTIMTSIVFLLYRIFDQTQKALRSNVTQVDVLEAGRAAVDLMSREIGQASAGGRTNSPAQPYLGLNLWIRPTEVAVIRQDVAEAAPRTNVLQEIFFLRHFNADWSGTAYRVLDATNGVGTLYRFSYPTNEAFLTDRNLLDAYQILAGRTNYQAVAEGVVHLQFTPYDHQGNPLHFAPRLDNNPRSAVSRQDGRDVYHVWLASEPGAWPADASLLDAMDWQTESVFRSNALPAYVEMEMGVLDPPTFAQYLSIPNPAAARSFLAEKAANVHLFRQRIPLRISNR